MAQRARTDYCKSIISQSKKIICVTALLLLSEGALAQDLPFLIEEAKNAVVTIYTYDKEGELLSLGTGFFMNEEGHIVTNYHVLAGSSAAEVVRENGTRSRIRAVLAEDKDRDLLKVVATSSPTKAEFLNLSPDLPAVGEEIMVIGSPYGLNHSVSNGIVSAVRELADANTIIQITAPISPGSSGSPVLNLKGEVIGIATSHLKEGQNLNFTVAARHIVELRAQDYTSFIEWSRNNRSLAEVPNQDSEQGEDEADPPTEEDQERVILYELFSDNSNGWPVGSGKGFSYAINKRSYILENSMDKRYIWADNQVDIAPDEDFTIEITFRKRRGKNSREFSLIWGLDGKNGHVFSIRGNQTYDIASIDSEGWSDRVEYAKSYHINEGSKANKLAVSRKGDNMNFLINDHIVETLIFEPLFGNSIAIGVEYGLEIEVYKVKVTVHN